MLFIPYQQKYKKQQKNKNNNRINLTYNLIEKYTTRLSLKTIRSGKISSIQLKSFFQCLRKYLKKKAVIIDLHIFPQIPITKKPLGVRMGKGKGTVCSWISKIKAGSLICDIKFKRKRFGLIAVKILKYAAKYKLTLTTKIIYNYGV